MFTESDPITLANLADGAASEMFGDELQKVLNNIVDPNTPPDKVRSVNLKVSIKPDKERQFAAIEITCDSKLAPYQGATTTAIIGKAGRHGEAREYKSTQQQLFPDNVEKVDFDTGEVIGKDN